MAFFFFLRAGLNLQNFAQYKKALIYLIMIG